MRDLWDKFELVKNAQDDWDARMGESPRSGLVQYIKELNMEE